MNTRGCGMHVNETTVFKRVLKWDINNSSTRYLTAFNKFVNSKHKMSIGVFACFIEF